MHFGYIPMTLN